MGGEREENICAHSNPWDGIIFLYFCILNFTFKIHEIPVQLSLFERKKLPVIRAV